MSGRPVIRLGDPTSHGGVVVSASPYTTAWGKPVARMGDHVACPIPGHGACVIVEGDPTVCIDGQPIALEGHLTSCGAALISTLSNVKVDHEESAAIPFSAAAATPRAITSNAGSDIHSSTPADTTHGIQFRAIDRETGEALSNRPYVVKRANGSTVTGTTDLAGYTEPIEAKSSENIEIHVLFTSPGTSMDAEEVC